MFPCSVLILLESEEGEVWGLFLFVSLVGWWLVFFGIFLWFYVSFYIKFGGHHLLPFQLSNQILEHGTLPFWPFGHGRI